MGYTKTTFDHTADGTEVYRYTLTNEQGASASFTNFGAIWLTMSVPDKDGQFDDVILGYDSLDIQVSRWDVMRTGSAERSSH